ncbi:MAG: copper chaperone PCu(A)C [Pseudomonadota bacterium]
MSHRFRIAAVLLTILAHVATGCTPADNAATLSFERGWVRTPAPNAKMTAGYVAINNDTAADVRITRAASPQFGRVEIHTTSMVDGVMQMRPVQALDVPAHGQVSLEPGGLHLMLMAAKGPLAADDSVIVTLFSDDRPVAELTLPLARSNPHDE